MTRALILLAGVLLHPDDPPLTAEQRTRLAQELDESIRRFTVLSEKEPTSVNPYSSRGDAYFMRGNFKEAVADYEKMVELDPPLGASHWRRGIAYFYAGRYKDAARQFEEYHSHDDVDRENGIWRYFSQVKAFGPEKAREGLLKYAKDDREPFPDVYQLFEGRRTPEEIIAKIKVSVVEDEEREKRYFYAHLYIGLHHAVAGRTDNAIPHLRKAVESTWPVKAGYGPGYMWHVGRLQYDLLSRPKKE